ncbi:MAG: RAMP superfamily CRISPR-associated protein [Anaerolineae bacterium]|jgi:CRISPR/Cas system CSM-associated protein Csm3 (group 7 of RAMP superfamily)
MRNMIVVRFRALSGLLVGSESLPVGPDRAFSPMGVKGSAVKGALRGALSALSRGPLSGRLSSCDETEPRRIARAHAAMGRECDVCRTFGAPGLPGHVSVSTARVERRMSLMRVSLNPWTGTAEENLLLTEERMPPYSEFDVQILMRVDGCEELRTLLLSLQALRFWRLGASGMVDLKLVDPRAVRELTSDLRCPDVDELVNSLSEYMWGEGDPWS